MAAQYLYNVYTQTILFSTILGRVCDLQGVFKIIFVFRSVGQPAPYATRGTEQRKTAGGAYYSYKSVFLTN
jgi:hypothetical protein